MDIRSILKFKDSYFVINREERNLAAILYHGLLIKENLNSFLSLINYKLPVIENEISIYYEYSFLRDLWFSIGKSDNDTKRRLILSLLNPNNISYLAVCPVDEFNSYFGVKSKDYIENPGNWRLNKFKDTIGDSNDEFLKICKFKWCFNAKPDIVIHTTKNHAVCIEAKYESGEGLYPSEGKEKKEFKRRNLNYVKQTEVQKLVMQLLGVESEFLIITQKNNITSTFKSISWQEAFSKLNFKDSPEFIHEWIGSFSTTQKVKKTTTSTGLIPKTSISKIDTVPSYQNHIAPDYKEKVMRLQSSFQNAYDFLRYPELKNTFIWLSTSVNAHLYYKDYYLCYIKIKDNGLMFRAGYNNMIVGDTEDMSHLLFSGKIQNLITSFNGVKDKWATIESDRVFIKKGAPEMFFKSLISLIENI